jgi:hypothetical protein
VDEGTATAEVLRRMASAWGQTAERLANADGFVASERETGPGADYDQVYAQTFAEEREHLRAALAGLPADLVRELVALFDAAYGDDG